MIDKRESKELLSNRNELNLFLEANELRKKQVGNQVSFIRNRNINFTDKCKINCDFCSFHDREGKTYSIEEVLEKIRDSEGIKEVCLQGGINPDLDYSYYLDLIKEINNNFDVHIHAFSPQEIYSMSNDSVKKTLEELKEAGLDTIPGTAAEILVDEVREKICPNKISCLQWRQIIKKAHKLGIKTTSTMMYGHVEDWSDRIDHLFKIRDIHEETEGFTEFIPLPFIDSEGKKTTDFKTDLKVISLSRLILGDSIKNIQASWVKLGLEKAIETLYFGANDLGGTLIEENITNIGCREKPSPTELKKKIKEANRDPIERTTLYKEVK